MNENIIKCPECGKEISASVHTCPNCGYPLVKDKITTSEKTTIVCPECKKEIPQGEDKCANCGYPINGSGGNMKIENIKNLSTVIAVLLYGCSGFFLYQGRDKMVNYYSSEYSSFTKNAYVGGDAYNYIINGTYATSFFVLAVGFMITATLFLAISIYIRIKLNNNKQDNKTDIEQIQLPPL